MGDLTENFSRSEFRCTHCGALERLDWTLVVNLQRLRSAVGRPLTIVSGFRCAWKNEAVGGIPSSQHLRGAAADIPRGYAPLALVKRCGFVGIGTRQGYVIHVDQTPGRRQFVFKE